jgi:hypothetical protein
MADRNVTTIARGGELTMRRMAAAAGLAWILASILLIAMVTFSELQPPPVATDCVVRAVIEDVGECSQPQPLLAIVTGTILILVLGSAGARVVSNLRHPDV